MKGRGLVLEAIDVHGHAMPLPVLRWLESQGLADLGDVASNVVRIDPLISGVGPGAPLPLAPSMTDGALRILELDELRLRAQAISLPPFLMASRCTDRDLVWEVTRRGNDALADYCSADPSRLLPLGLVPVGWDSAVDEARRCLDELGMRGVAIGSRGADLDLDAPVNDQLWTFLADRKSFVFLHPSAVPDPRRLADFWLPQLVGYPVETAIAAYAWPTVAAACRRCADDSIWAGSARSRRARSVIRPAPFCVSCTTTPPSSTRLRFADWLRT
jgi:aminocarboxymuconate-semialdehyde decarboxylase